MRYPPPLWTSFHRPDTPAPCHSEGDCRCDLECDAEGQPRSLARPERRTRCNCSRYQYFTPRRLSRHATLSSLCSPSCDVTSASPVDPRPLPRDVIDDVRDPRTNRRLSVVGDASEFTWPDEPDMVYSDTPTRRTTDFYSLRRY